MVRLTGKQRQFLDLYAKTGEAKKAAITVGYTPISAPQMAKRILQSSVAQEYLANLRSDSRAIVAYDLAQAMTESLEVIQYAKEHKNAMAYFKAVEHRAKLSGLLIERIHIEKVDLTEALRMANLRISDVIQPTLDLPVLEIERQPEQNSTGGVPVGVGARLAHRL